MFSVFVLTCLFHNSLAYEPCVPIPHNSMLRILAVIIMCFKPLNKYLTENNLSIEENNLILLFFCFFFSYYRFRTQRGSESMKQQSISLLLHHAYGMLRIINQFKKYILYRILSVRMVAQHFAGKAPQKENLIPANMTDGLFIIRPVLM